MAPSTKPGEAPRTSSSQSRPVGLYSPPHLQDFFDAASTKGSIWSRRGKYDTAQLWNSVLRGDVEELDKCLQAGLSVNYSQWCRRTQIPIKGTGTTAALPDGMRSLIDVAVLAKNPVLLHRVLQDEPDLTGSAAAARAESNRGEAVALYSEAEQEKLQTAIWSTPLHLAATHDRKESLEILIDEARADVNVRDPRARTPLLCAILAGSTAAVRLLLDRGASVDLVDMDGVSPLIACSLSGNVDMVNLCLFFAASVDQQDRYGETALMKAASSGHYDIVRLLLLSHADFECRNEAGMTAFFKAASVFCTDVMDALIQHGAEPDTSDVNGCTPLIRAAMAGNTALAKQLLRYGGNVDCTDADGWTALVASMIAAADDITQLLLLHGADVFIPDYAGSTPLHAAARYNSALVARHCLHKDAFAADPALIDTLTTAAGETPLALAAAHGSVAILRLLLRAGARPALRDANGYTALDRAAYHGQATCARILLASTAPELARVAPATLQAVAQGRRDRPEALEAYDAIGHALRGVDPVAAAVIPRPRTEAEPEPCFARLFAHDAGDAVARMRQKQGKAVAADASLVVPSYVASTANGAAEEAAAAAAAMTQDPFEAVGATSTSTAARTSRLAGLMAAPLVHRPVHLRPLRQQYWGSSGGKTRK